MKKKPGQKDSELPEQQEKSPIVSDTPVMDWLWPRVTDFGCTDPRLCC